MLTIRYIAESALTVLEREEARNALQNRDGLIWVDLVEPVDHERAFLLTLGVAELVVDDVVNQRLQPMSDIDADDLLLVVHVLDLNRDAADPAALKFDIVVRRNLIVTHAATPVPVLAAVSMLVEREPGLLSSPEALLYRMLDAAVDSFLAVLTWIDDEAEKIDDLLFADKPDHAIHDEIYRLRRRVVRLQRITQPQAQMFARLTALAGERLDEPRGLGHHAERLYRGLADKLDRVIDLTVSYRIQLDSALDQYQTMVMKAQNEIVKVLALVSTVLLPITVIAGIYGMNFVYMPELGLRWMYPAVWAVIVTILLGVPLWFRRRGWIGS